MVKYYKDRLSIMPSAKLQKHRSREIRQGKAQFFIFISLLSTNAQLCGALCLLTLKVQINEVYHHFPQETFLYL